MATLLKSHGWTLWLPFSSRPPVEKEPDQVYEGITFDDFLKIWEGINIETKMHVRFLTLEPMALCY